MAEHDDPDLTLLQRLRSGDDSAFDAIMERYQRPVLNFVYRMLNDAHEAEDVAQDVFVRVYRNVKCFDPRAKFSTWLFQIARNAALDRARRKKFQSLEDFLEILPIVGRTPAADLQSLEMSEQIGAAVQELPEDQRAALVLAEYEGRSHADIAAILKTSERSVEGRLYRAKQFLRKRLAHLM
jgi:RNA polymerase sigma-70 factor (ECF subfamily)